MAIATSRLFVALRLPDEIVVALVDLQRELRRCLRDARISWIAAADLHLTLRFLGDVETTRIDLLCAALRETAERCRSLRLDAIGTGCFPTPRAPRIVWAGISEHEGRLAALVDEVNTASAGVSNAEPDKAFMPHVTLGRCRSLTVSDKRRLRGFLRATAARDLGAWRTQDFALIESNPDSPGRRYTVIERFSLAAA